VGAGDLAVAFVKLTLLGLSVGSVSFAVGGATGRRQAAVAAGAGVGVLMYLLNTLAVMNGTVRSLRYASLFHWAGGASPLGKPLDWGGVLVMVAIALVLLGATLVLFERRDLRS
jgi:ABC-2 type transport system permease protein